MLIKNGQIMDPATGRNEIADLLISPEGKVLRIEAGITPEKDEEVLDASGCIVAPGLVDPHVHFRDPGFPEKEDILTGAAAAAKGGYTSVVMMANTKPTVDNPETLRYVTEKGKQTRIRVYAAANVTKGMQGVELTDMETLRAGGAVGFTDDGKPLTDKVLVRRAMERVRELGVPISFHEEDPELIANNGVNEGKASTYFGIQGSPRQAEIRMITRDLILAKETGARVIIQHISTAEGVELVRQAKAAGLDVHAEATPHHFTLTEEDLELYGTLAKMNPPLRTEKDRVAIAAGLRDGSIDMIATDHAPHTAEEKRQSITRAPSGIIGLETALPLGITQLVETGELSMMELLRCMSTTPAQVWNLDAGSLEPGRNADLVIFDPKEKRIVGETFASKACNSPFIGWELSGVVKYTVCGGRAVYRDGADA
ncbi:MAG: dihydroorotase [Lachnospiraceae bacterium]|nr:dihydroorotase [Lachnospiraceae bacterium]